MNALTMAQVKKIYRGYYAQTAIKDGDHYLASKIKGMQVRIDENTVITVGSVMNAGFNGMQIGGRTEAGVYRIAFI